MDKEKNGKEVFILALLLNNGAIYNIRYTDIKQAEKQAENLFSDQEEKSVSILKFKNGSSIYIRKTSIDSISIYPKGQETFGFPNDGIEKKIHSLIEVNKKLIESSDELIEINSGVAETNNKLWNTINDAMVQERKFQKYVLKSFDSLQASANKEERYSFEFERILKDISRNIERVANRR